LTLALGDVDDSDQARRFGGLARLYGDRGALKIRESHVVIVGIGGVGSWVAEALARSGVSTLTLIDLDHVAESNINRQVHALTSTLGQAKVLAMRDRIAEINPICLVRCVEEFVTADNWSTLLPAGVDAVIDACDDMKAKLTMAAWALKIKSKDTVFIPVGAAGGKRLAHRVNIDDLSKTTHDPLLAQLRYRLRKNHGAKQNGKSIGIACVYSDEPVAMPSKADSSDAAPNADAAPIGLNCHGYGSSVAVTATFGQCAAGWVLDRLAGKSQKNSLVSQKA
jgi:tRNA threonylcarbamoyladenosine dehydratase